MKKILFSLVLMLFCLLTSCFGTKKYDLSNITFEGETVVYDGEEHSIYIQGDLPEGLSVEYLNNSHVDAGKYRVTANLIELENNSVFRVMEAFLEITKKDITSEIAFEDVSYVYDRTEHTHIIDNLPDGINVEYTDNVQINAGSYEVVASLEDTTGNYIVPNEVRSTMNIEKKDITSEITFEDATYSHNGKEYTHIIENIPEGINVEYVNNKHADAGTYEVVAILEDTTGNYIVPNEVKSIMTIVKDGQTHEVKFVIDGQIVSTKFIKNGECIHSFPKLLDVAGHTGSWEYDLNNPVLEDIVINAKYTPNTYQISYEYGYNIIQKSIVYGSEIELFDVELYGYIFNGWTYLGESFEEVDYLFTTDITLKADFSFDSSVQIFDYLNSIGDVSVGDGTQAFAFGKTAIPFGNTQGEKWYVEVELKFDDVMSNDYYPKIGIMCGNNLGMYDDGQTTTLFYYLDFARPNVNTTWNNISIIGSTNGYLDWSNPTAMSVDNKYHTDENIKLGILRDGNLYYLYYGVGNTYKCINVIYNDSFDGESCYVWVAGYSCEYLASNPYVLRENSVYTVFKTPTDVTVSNESITLYTSESNQIEYQCDVLDYDKSAVVFASSDESVAVVDDNGIVTGVNAGECIISISVGSVVKEVSVLVILKEKGAIDGIMDDTIWSENVKATKVVLSNNVVDIQVYAAKNEKGIYFFIDYKATSNYTNDPWFLSNNVQFKLFNGANKEIVQTSASIWFVSTAGSLSHSFTEAYIPKLVYNNASKLYEGKFEMFLSYADLGISYTENVSFVVGSDLATTNWCAEKSWDTGNTSGYHVITKNGIAANN